MTDSDSGSASGSAPGSNHRREPWRTLGIDETQDRGAIRRAYATQLRALDIDREIAAYQQLRGARDHALMLAKRDEFDDEPAALSPFEEDDDYSPAEQTNFPSADPEAADGELASDPRPEPVVEPHPPHESEEWERSPEPVPEPAAATVATPEDDPPAPPMVLLSILYLGDEYSAEPLDNEGFIKARTALDGVLAEAEESSIDQQQAIEEWLAHHLASSWPRSAWLVEHASENFSWLDESGSLTERPAVRFLNERLRGMRFVEKVQQADHPLRGAWAELAKPGRRRNFLLTSVSKDSVRMLLNGVRERYPEVESYLDPQRVGSWEEKLNNSSGTPWRTALYIAFGVMVVLRIFGGFSQSMQNEGSVPAHFTVEAPAFSADVDQEKIDAVASDLFGPELTSQQVRRKVPEGLWTSIEYAGSPNALLPRTGTVVEPLQQLRLLTQLAAGDARFDQLIAIKQIKLDLLRSIRENSGAERCGKFDQDLLVPADLPASPELRQSERQLAAQLLQQGLLKQPPANLPEQATISGEVVDRFMKATGMTRDEFSLLASGKGSGEMQCRYKIAMLELALRRPADVSVDLLRML